MHDKVDRIVQNVLDAAADKPVVDAVDELGAEMTTNVVLEFVGVPQSDWEPLRQAVFQSFSPSDPRHRVEGQAPHETYLLAREYVIKYAIDLANRRRDVRPRTSPRW